MNIVRKPFQFIILLFFLVQPIFSQNVQFKPSRKISIYNVSWQQRWPWNGQIDINIDSNCYYRNWDGTPVQYKISLAGYDRTLQRILEMKSYSGFSPDSPLTASQSLNINWDVARDYPDFRSSAFSIKANGTAFPKTIPADYPEILPGRYLVIYLDNRQEKYSYRYTTQGPDISQNYCRTWELWLREIPAGSVFVPRNPFGESKPPYQITITRPFYISVFEITRCQWATVMSGRLMDPIAPRAMFPVSAPIRDIRGFNPAETNPWPDNSWGFDEGSFLSRLRKKTGLLLDLPTDCQWEYACRAGTSTAWNSGKNQSGHHSATDAELDKLGRYKGNIQDGRGDGILESNNLVCVGSYYPNQWGLFDMHGNIHEFCLYSMDPRAWGRGGVDSPPFPPDLKITYKGGNSVSPAGMCASDFYRVIPANNNPGGGFRIISHIPEYSSRYLVIDLSEGTSAEKFPYRYTSTPPILSQNLCRTSELWLREIPAGSYISGSPNEELGHNDSENQMAVNIVHPFYIGVFEVTRQQWELVMGTVPPPPNSPWQNPVFPVTDVSYDQVRGTVSSQQPDNVPPDTFVSILRKKTGLMLDLPTEAQWEYACRAGTTTSLNSGKDLSDDQRCPELDLLANYGDTSYRPEPEKLEVGFLQPNAWGLYDMHGNAGEWCRDCRRDISYSSPIRYEDFIGRYSQTEPVDNPDAPYRAIRGGAYNQPAIDCRSASRRISDPATQSSFVGFRMICLPQPVQERYLVINLDQTNSPDNKFSYTFTNRRPVPMDETSRTKELWLREIPAGSFIMGSPKNEYGRLDNEDMHTVTISRNFYIGVFEITYGQWQRVMNGSPANGSSYDSYTPANGMSYDTIRGTDATSPDSDQPHPQSFIARLRERTGLLLDIPTEAQWEYACRAGSSTAFSSGQNMMQGEDAVIQVTSLTQNAWGLYDMHGGAEEWCRDDYTQHLGTNARDNPLIKVSPNSNKVLKGGNFYNLDSNNNLAAKIEAASKYRSASRRDCPPDYAQYDRNRPIGFRIASYPQEEPPSTPSTEAGHYLVVDLRQPNSDGTFPHRFTMNPPDVSNPDCQTKELWLREIPAGRFMMGSPENEIGRYDNETQHEVTLTQKFYIGIFEVSEAQWEIIMSGKTDAHLLQNAVPKTNVPYEDIILDRPGYQNNPDSFISRIRTKTGLNFNLPTEAQWEYACRAKTATAFNTGDTLSQDQNPHILIPAMEYIINTPNAWGLYRMHGFVWEYCLDGLGDLRHGETDPVHFGHPPVARGGDIDFNSQDEYVIMEQIRKSRSASRGGIDRPHPRTGFRLVVIPPDSIPSGRQ